MSTLPITYKCSSPVTDGGRFWLRKATKEYKLFLVSKQDWEETKSKFSEPYAKPYMIFNLGAIVEVLNANKSTIELGPDSSAIKDRMMAACKKHNDHPIQYLKYLIIPWIVCKIFGWTCMTTYELPSFTVNAPEQLQPKVSETDEPVAPLEGAKKDEEASSKIDLTGQRLTTIPEWVLQRKDLKELILEDNDLSDLPEDLGQLSQLEVLILGHNPFTKIPDVIFKLTNLKHLSFHGTIEARQSCQLKLDKTTPEKFAALSKLERLEFTYTGLGEMEWIKRAKQKKGIESTEEMLKKHLPPKCVVSF